MPPPVPVMYSQPNHTMPMTMVVPQLIREQSIEGISNSGQTDEKLKSLQKELDDVKQQLLDQKATNLNDNKSPTKPQKRHNRQAKHKKSKNSVAQGKIRKTRRGRKNNRNEDTVLVEDEPEAPNRKWWKFW